MKKIETILKSLLEISSLDNFTINDGVLYILTNEEPTVTAYFDIEGNLEYAEAFNIQSHDICSTSDIRQIWYAHNNITIVTNDDKIILSASGCSLMAFQKPFSIQKNNKENILKTEIFQSLYAPNPL